jgi:transposase InsO family protein
LAHPNARLTPYGRLQIVKLRKEGYTQAAIAEMMGVSRASVSKWLGRHAREGVAGLTDRSSRPRQLAHELAADLVAAICALRRERAWGPHRIGYALGLARSTVYAVLRRAGLHRLAWLHRSTREVIRYERSQPGELLHLDVKKLGRIPDGGGKRFDPGFRETGAGRQVSRGLGHDFIHVAIDDHSRYAYAEALPNERGETTAAFLARALATFQAIGVRVERILTDNGGNYRSHAFAAVAAAHQVQLRRTRPYRPQTNGKAEAFNKTLQREWAYVRLYRSNAQRLAALQVFLAEYNATRPHTALGGLPPLSRICQ